MKRNPLVRNLALTNGGFALVDAERYDELSKLSWRMSTFGYAVCNVGPRKANVTLRLHRVVMNAPVGMEVDHINGDKLDNRATNLRVCTRQQNGKNVQPRPGHFKGISRMRDRWAAQIKSGGERKFLGLHDTPEEAARAYDAAAREMHGEYARLNFPPGSDG